MMSTLRTVHHHDNTVVFKPHTHSLPLDDWPPVTWGPCGRSGLSSVLDPEWQTELPTEVGSRCSSSITGWKSSFHTEFPHLQTFFAVHRSELAEPLYNAVFPLFITSIQPGQNADSVFSATASLVHYIAFCITMCQLLDQYSVSAQILSWGIDCWCFLSLENILDLLTAVRRSCGNNVLKDHITTPGTPRFFSLWWGNSSDVLPALQWMKSLHFQVSTIHNFLQQGMSWSHDKLYMFSMMFVQVVAVLNSVACRGC